MAIRIREQAGVPFEFVARSYFPDRPYAALAEQIDRIGTELAPLLRNA